MKANMEWINRTMAASGLAAAGPMRIVSTELGRENYTFDVVQPVRRGAAKADTADEGEEDGEAAPAPVAAASSGPLTGIKLQGPVKYEHTEAGRAATGSYVGYMAELEAVRNAVRAWTLTQGEEAVGRPYEVYKNGIDQAFTADGQYQVYWMLKP
jgi:hypothetical protein